MMDDVDWPPGFVRLSRRAFVGGSAACAGAASLPARAAAIVCNPGDLASMQASDFSDVAPGLVGSRIAFVDERGPLDQRIRRLAMMNQDVTNLRYLTGGEEDVHTPRVSPEGRHIAYASMARDGRARVWLMDLATGERRIVGDRSDETYVPHFSPDGRMLIMSVARPDADMNLLAVELATMVGTRLTDGAAIDTAACYSPDGQTICFESDREGHPQLFLMDARGGPARRINSGTGTYWSPAWSPRGDTIAFVKHVQGEGMLGLMGTDGSNERNLSWASRGPAPTFAPDGQALMFFRETHDAVGSTALFAISLDGRHEFRLPTPGFASDPDWSMRLV